MTPGATAAPQKWPDADGLTEDSMKQQLWWFDLSRFEGDGGGGAGGAGTEGGEGEGQGGQGGGGEGETKPKSFTQAELDKIVSDRLAREKAKYGDYDDLKTKAAKLDELDAANKSELEKAQQTATKATEERDAARKLARDTALRAAVVAEAATAGAINPADVIAVLPADAVTVDDDGTVTGAKEAVAAVLEARPHWKDPTTPRGSADGGARGGSGDVDFRTASKDQVAAELAKYGIRPRS